MEERQERTSRRLAPPDRPRDGVVRHLAILLHLAQALGRRADELGPLAALDVKHVRRGIELPQVAVRARGRCGSAQEATSSRDGDTTR